MGATPIHNPLPGEDLLGIEPELLQQVDPGWRHRLALFTGRALSDTALKNEQAYRAGRLALLGQAVTPGTARGLELALDATAPDPLLQVTPGYGISAIGEDVTLLRTLQTTLGTLAVVDPQTGSVLKAFKEYAADAGNTSHVGIFVLMPIVAKVADPTTGTGSPLLVSGVDASCDSDPEAYAFENLQIVDGARLVLVAWPGGLTLPDPNPVDTWRNRLAYHIFDLEMSMGADEYLPWQLLGVPLALGGFGPTWQPLFVDQSAVVRSGGLPRRRYAMPALAGGPKLVQPALAEARSLQLTEQISQLPSLSRLASVCALLPPSGILPAAALNLRRRNSRWFPSNWQLHVGPVHQEEIETVLRTGMTAAPLDLTQPEEIEILLPLPDAVYDPNILVTEEVAPEFAEEEAKATAERDTVLQHRKALQLEANVLLKGLGQVPINPDAGLSDTEIAARDAAAFPLPASEIFGTATVSGVLLSTDIQGLLTSAAAAPYTVTGPAPSHAPLPLFSADDLKDLTDNGVQHFITRINLKVSKADDLLDLAFLTSQTDIYRFRQNVLGATEASRLATSPILANIATGETATATASNLRNYIASVTPPARAAGLAMADVTAESPGGGGAFNANIEFSTSAQHPALRQAEVGFSPNLILNPAIGPGRTTGNVATLLEGTALLQTGGLSVQSQIFTPVSLGINLTATPKDIQQQSPLVGAQLNIRTLTIADRLKQSPSQEGLFYGVGNRLAFLQLLLDIELTIEDLTFLVDDSSVPPSNTNPSPTQPFAIAHLRDTARFASVMAAVAAPRVNNDSDEAGLFSTGVRVMEQHTQLMRAIEGRIQRYRDFVALATTALANVRANLQKVQALLTQLENELAQVRQNLAFVAALLADETQRVQDVNTQRAQILSTVTIVAYSRPRTLQTEADVPSRQLVPGNIASPVPACLQQGAAVPPELREVVALLREAPINWLPAVQALLNRLERPVQFQSIAVSTQARAFVQLQLPLPASSAGSSPGVYAPVISGIYASHQQVFRRFQAQRAAFQPIQLAQQSWSAQLQTVQNISAVADLVASDAVHAEIANATTRLIQQISTVATCLYMRVGLALPKDRLEWTEFLRAAGLSIQLRSLAVLPNWNSQHYTDRQQMQILVDWLFQQIDTANPSTVAFMSDVVRVAILLASHAPVNDVIAAAVATRVKPVIGGVISLPLPSGRVAHGMSVQLYRAGALAAQATVSDLDSATVRATVTNVYQPNVFLETGDMVHFTPQTPQAVVLKAFT